MSLLQRCKRSVIVIGLVAATGAYAQVSSINSAVITPRVFNDVPGGSLTTVNDYPTSMTLSMSGVSDASAPASGLDRSIWQFSNNGSSAYAFQHNDYFNASFDLNLTGTPITPRKEAGFLFHTTSGNGDIQFIVNTDGHEVVQFGGISFYSFSANNIVSYNSGDTINLRMSYFLDSNNKNALQFFANGNPSPVFEFGPGAGNGALDIGDGSTLGGYFQIQNDPSNPGNSGSALFQNIIIAVPEPSTYAVLACGILALALFRRRN